MNTSNTKEMVVAKALLLAAFMQTTACPTGSAAKMARGNDPGATDAFGTRTCTGPGRDVEPWVVDMPADRRVEIEAATQKGVVLLSYDCKNLEIVRGCTTAGNYGYTGTTLVEDEVILEDADAVAANLSGGPFLAAKLEAEMRRGMKVHIGYMLVGQRSTTVGRVYRGDLVGDCGRVTHFISRTSLGAYAVVANSSAKMGATAELFARGAGTSSSSSSFKTTTAGEKNACLGATSEDMMPPVKCRAPVKLLLTAISETAIAESDAPAFDGERELQCPPGMVRRNGICARQKADEPRACLLPNYADCIKQCDGGNASSCATVGFMYESGKGVNIDEKLAFRHYQQSCEKGVLDGCVGLAFLYSKGRGVDADAMRAAKLFRDACERGHARGCSGIGQQARIEGNVTVAIRSFERSCALGYARACFYAGNELAKEGKEPERAFRNHEKACLGRDHRSCLAMAGMMFSGLGTLLDAEKANRTQGNALNALSKSCAGGDGEACEVIGHFYDGRFGKKVRKPEKALEHYGKACSMGRGEACRAAGMLLERSDGSVVADPAKAKEYLSKACSSGVKEACK